MGIGIAKRTVQYKPSTNNFVSETMKTRALEIYR